MVSDIRVPNHERAILPRGGSAKPTGLCLVEVAGLPKGEDTVQDPTNDARSSQSKHEATEADRLDQLADIALSRADDAVNRTMALAREVLGMDVAFVSRFTRDRMLF